MSEASAALWEVFHRRTGGLGGRPAVSSSAGELSFEELWKEADRLASQFAGAGVPESAVVGLALPNSPRFLAAFLALCRLNTTVALLSPQYRPGELSAIVAGVGTACVVAEKASASAVSEAMPIARSSTADGLDVLFPSAESSAASAALLKFSSGSTAEPKGIALSASNVLAEVENVTQTLGLGGGDRIHAGVPLFHSYGFDLGVLPTVYAGSTLVLEDVFVPRRTLAALG